MKRELIWEVRVSHETKDGQRGAFLLHGVATNVFDAINAALDVAENEHNFKEPEVIGIRAIDAMAFQITGIHK